MSIEAIKQRLNNLGAGKIVKYDNTMNLATQYALDYKNDIEFLLEQNQRLAEERDSFQRVGIKVQEVNVRLVEALEEVVLRGHDITTDEILDDYIRVFNVAKEAIQAYKLLEKKD